MKNLIFVVGIFLVGCSSVRADVARGVRYSYQAPQVSIVTKRTYARPNWGYSNYQTNQTYQAYQPYQRHQSYQRYPVYGPVLVPRYRYAPSYGNPNCRYDNFRRYPGININIR